MCGPEVAQSPQCVVEQALEIPTAGRSDELAEVRSEAVEVGEKLPVRQGDVRPRAAGRLGDGAAGGHAEGGVENVQGRELHAARAGERPTVAIGKPPAERRLDEVQPSLQRHARTADAIDELRAHRLDRFGQPDESVGHGGRVLAL
jgi:hypothetical protein